MTFNKINNQVSFSYYTSHAVKADSVLEGDVNLDGRNVHVVQNTYLKSSDWGWQIDPVGLRYFTGTKAIKNIIVAEADLLNACRSVFTRESPGFSREECQLSKLRIRTCTKNLLFF